MTQIDDSAPISPADRPFVHGKTKLLEREGKIARMTFTDKLVGDDGARVEALAGKGVIGALMTAHLYRLLNANSVPTHYIRSLDATALEVRWLRMLELEVVVRGTALGSFCRRYGVVRGEVLRRPVVELFLKSDELGDPLISPDAAEALGYATSTELQSLSIMAVRIWNVVSAEFARVDVRLLDIKFEFGEQDGILYLADEIGFDTLRASDLAGARRVDKDAWYERRPGVMDNLRELEDRLAAWNTNP